MTIKTLLSSSKQAKVFGILSLSTLFCIMMVLFRMHHTNTDLASLQSTEHIIASRGSTFIFLIWNLFLAWIPYWIAISLHRIYQWTNSKALSIGWMMAWLAFFPNAPYIITDLLHLHQRPAVPFWYDLMLIVSFAWTGFLLGLLSLHEIRVFIKKMYSEKLSWYFTIAASVLCGFGIYLGRCLRWNSWDILTQPGLLFQDILVSLTDSMAINITLLFSVFLILSYLTLNVLINQPDR